MKSIISESLTLLAIATILPSCKTQEKSDHDQPNIVLIFLDDAGWGDFRPFAEPRYETPNIKQLAKEGQSFYNFYVPQAICSASRGALLTGCYPEHTKLFGAHEPGQKGMDPKFMTIAETLKENNYKTAIFGKWHIGDQPDTRPHVRGFDETAGIMYSNDMWAGHPENPEFWGRTPLQYWENGKVTIDTVTAEHQKQFTTWFTEKSVDFINRHKNEPFFLYVPHPQPHVPLFCSDKFEGRSGTGLYGDVIMEIDWSVGQIMKALKDNGVEDNTLVIFTSDNGPWLSYGNHAGQTPFREGKASSFDGGARSPLIMKYPGYIKANTVSYNTFFSIDFFPTFCYLTGADLPTYEIDGKNVWDIITDKSGAQNPHEYYAITTGRNFEAIISADGKWKLHLPHGYRNPVKGGNDGSAGKYQQLKIDTSLYNMVTDPYEKINVYDHYPEISKKLLSLAEKHKEKYFN